MDIAVENTVSVSEENFPKIMRLADEKGAVIILKNNLPRYVLLDYNLFSKDAAAEDADIDSAASRILKKHFKAFEELAR
jgi:antitoxin Phd